MGSASCEWERRRKATLVPCFASRCGFGLACQYRALFDQLVVWLVLYCNCESGFVMVGHAAAKYLACWPGQVSEGADTACNIQIRNRTVVQSEALRKADCISRQEKWLISADATCQRAGTYSGGEYETACGPPPHALRGCRRGLSREA